VFICVVR